MWESYRLGLAWRSLSSCIIRSTSSALASTSSKSESSLSSEELKSCCMSCGSSSAILAPKLPYLHCCAGRLFARNGHSTPTDGNQDNSNCLKCPIEPTTACATSGAQKLVLSSIVLFAQQKTLWVRSAELLNQCQQLASSSSWGESEWVPPQAHDGVCCCTGVVLTNVGSLASSTLRSLPLSPGIW